MVTSLMLAIVAAGLGAVVSGVWLERMSCRAAGWPSVAAEVTRSARLPDPLGVGGTAEFKYRFTINGRLYESSRVSFAATWPSEARLLRLVARFPVGCSVTAWYNPQDPSTAVIERPRTSGGRGLALAGSLLVAAGLILA
jgi:hypothetical protein